MTVNTGKVARRELHFDSLEQLLAEAERLAAADNVVTRGNWTLAQILMHLAAAMHMSIDGAQFRPPWIVRLIGPLLKGRMLKKMPAGFKLPAHAAKQLVAGEETELSDALASLRDGVARLQSDPHREPHAALGRLSLDEWNRLHLRHAEMHLGFVETVE